eukprot:577003-Pelagomonas_calceolata.AAC.10
MEPGLDAGLWMTLTSLMHVRAICEPFSWARALRICRYCRLILLRPSSKALADTHQAMHKINGLASAAPNGSTLSWHSVKRALKAVDTLGLSFEGTPLKGHSKRTPLASTSGHKPRRMGDQHHTHFMHDGRSASHSLHAR